MYSKGTENLRGSAQLDRTIPGEKNDLINWNERNLTLEEKDREKDSGRLKKISRREVLHLLCVFPSKGWIPARKLISRYQIKKNFETDWEVKAVHHSCFCEIKVLGKGKFGA